MLRDRCMCNLEITGNLVITDAGPCTGFIYRATDMSPVRILGGSTWEPTSGQVMCTGWIIFIKIDREVQFHFHTVSVR
ncbi:Hypothetical predicted protein [Scomber scombrus]|uniref:Uncharacterized protein n=1 Tax=Scomber scombrus TaxID=13677 RepID=A0AAV1MUM4_SCOSC